MSETTVILLGHKSLAGKDTFFEAVRDMGFVRVAFADKLKRTVADLYGFSQDQMYGDTKDEQDYRYPNTFDKLSHPDYKPFFTPRRILQIFGQQQRALYPDIWAAYPFYTEIPQLMKQGHTKFVVTDFRFKNEGTLGEKWQLDNSKFNRLHTLDIERPGVQARSGANDISETELDDYNFQNVIVNDGSLEEFKSKAREFVRGI